MVRLGVVRGLAFAVFVCGIAGMIVTTLTTDNNNGWVASFGLLTAAASVVLMAVAATTRALTEPPSADATGEEVERRIQALVDAGADEATVRDLVRQAVRLGRTTRG